jgi:ankyrin repeat protein
MHLGQIQIAAVTAAVDGGFPVTATDVYGCTLLHYVAFQEEFKLLVPRMLASGWDPNAKNHKGVTPVHYACLDGASDALQMLVAAGGLLNVPASDGCTPAFYACCSPPLLEWLATRSEVDWCHVNHDGLTVLGAIGVADIGYRTQQRCRTIVAGAVAAQRRWSPLRAAFVGVAVIAGRK